MPARLIYNGTQKITEFSLSMHNSRAGTQTDRHSRSGGKIRFKCSSDDFTASSRAFATCRDQLPHRRNAPRTYCQNRLAKEATVTFDPTFGKVLSRRAKTL